MTDDDRVLLAFARRTWRHAGAQDAAIREELGMTPTRYFQRLYELIRTPEALAADPVLVNRLRRRARLAG